MDTIKMIKVTPQIGLTSGVSITTTSSPGTGIQLAPLSLGTNANLVDLGKKLLDASRNGETEEVRSLMQSGAPFTTDWLGTSPLHFAAQYGHTDTAEVLLRAGISRDARTKVDRTPLHIASQEGHIAIVSLLIMHGADIDAKDMLKMTPLHWSVERGHTDVAECLLTNGADINIYSKFEKTPIEIAYDNGRLEMVPMLQKYIGVSRPKPEPKQIPNPAVKMKQTILPNRNRTTKSPKFPKCQQTSMKPLYLPGNFSNWQKAINLDNLRKLFANSGESSLNPDDLNAAPSNTVLATLAALAASAASPSSPSNIAAEALQWLETNGASMNNSQNDSNLFQSTFESGPTISLTEAGKLALNWVKEQQSQIAAAAATTANSTNKNSKVITIVADSTQLPQIINSTQATPIVLVSGSSLQESGETTLSTSSSLSSSSNSSKLNRRSPMKVSKVPTFTNIKNNVNTPNVKHVLISNSSNDTREVEKLQRELELMRKQAEEYKSRLLQKEREAERYKKQLDEIRAIQL